MKNIKFFLLLVLAALCLSSCEESGIVIPEFEVGDKTVVVEEVTGVRCPNCPEGTKELVRLDSLFGEKLIIVSVHAAGNFSVPHTPSNDFRNPDVQNMANYVGELEGFPTAAIDRRLIPPNTTAFILSAPSWGGFITQELAKAPGMAMYMENNYNETSRNLNVKVTVLPDMNIDNNPHLTVLITQDSIIDQQDITGQGTVPNYLHRHVLRKMFTNFDGNTFSAPLTAGTPQEQNFSFTLPIEWVASHCSVVAYVHRSGTPNKEILQAIEKHVE